MQQFYQKMEYSSTSVLLCLFDEMNQEDRILYTMFSMILALVLTCLSFLYIDVWGDNSLLTITLWVVNVSIVLLVYFSETWYEYLNNNIVYTMFMTVIFGIFKITAKTKKGGI